MSFCELPFLGIILNYFFEDFAPPSFKLPLSPSPPPYFLTSLYFLRIFLQLIAYYLFFCDFTLTSVIFLFPSIPFYFVGASFLYPVFISEESSIISWGHYRLVVGFFSLQFLLSFLQNWFSLLFWSSCSLWNILFICLVLLNGLLIVLVLGFCKLC